LAGPLEKGISETVEKELIDINSQPAVQSFLETKYNWDELASNHVWAFGPEYYGSNVLVNDSLVSDTNQEALNRVKQSTIQGFRWSTREGPLCDEPMRNVKFRII
jgi:U5 small nuclear ribonucleoprotein component